MEIENREHRAARMFYRHVNIFGRLLRELESLGLNEQDMKNLTEKDNTSMKLSIDDKYNEELERIKDKYNKELDDEPGESGVVLVIIQNILKNINRFLSKYQGSQLHRVLSHKLGIEEGSHIATPFRQKYGLKGGKNSRNVKRQSRKKTKQRSCKRTRRQSRKK